MEKISQFKAKKEDIPENETFAEVSLVDETEENIHSRGVEARPDDTSKNIEAGEPTKVEAVENAIILTKKEEIVYWNKSMVALNENIVSKEEKVKELNDLLKKNKEDREAGAVDRLLKEINGISEDILKKECELSGKNSEQAKEEVENEMAAEYQKQLETLFGAEKFLKQEEAAKEMRKQREMQTILLERLKGISGADQRKYGYDEKDPEGSVQKFYKTVFGDIYRATMDDDGKNGSMLSPEAMCRMIQQNLEPEKITIAGGIETTKYALSALKNFAGADAIMKVSREGGLVAVPETQKINKKDKTIVKTMTRKELNDLITENDSVFKNLNSNASETEFRMVLERYQSEQVAKQYNEDIRRVLLDKMIMEKTKDVLREQNKLMGSEQLAQIEAAKNMQALEKMELAKKLTAQLIEAKKSVKSGNKTNTKEIVENANKLSGRDLSKEAKSIKGTKEERQVWITKEIRRILKKQQVKTEKKEEIIKLDDKDVVVIDEPAQAEILEEEASMNIPEQVNSKIISSDDFNADKIIEWEKEVRKKEIVDSLNKKNKSNWFSKIFNRKNKIK